MGSFSTGTPSLTFIDNGPGRFLGMDSVEGVEDIVEGASLLVDVSFLGFSAACSSSESNMSTISIFDVLNCRFCAVFNYTFKIVVILRVNENLFVYDNVSFIY